jgi:hypothetical protein
MRYTRRIAAISKLQTIANRDSSDFKIEGPMAQDSEHAKLEIYKLAVEMADRTSARRAVVNSYYLTVVAALISLFGLFRSLNVNDSVGVILLAVSGFVISVTWWFVLRSFRLLSSAKYSVINSMEAELPAKIFGPEWDVLLLTGRSRGRAYIRIGLTERVPPLLFAVLFIVMLFV